jgi:hypothetical protein
MNDSTHLNAAIFTRIFRVFNQVEYVFSVRCSWKTLSPLYLMNSTERVSSENAIS